ncbi:VOC family protein [Burkholderia anthina]|uniref:VOC family protein n=1 Tax=Burkholderia anthina TaxID=179879 RepID=UPI0007541914|nr:VOC family protein [Burkholderia anthina]KVE06791.1 hypothetical protein WS65_12355 [Burkholderia anthina]
MFSHVCVGVGDTARAYDFYAPTRAHVDRCHAFALRHGGTCEGPPGLRPHYHRDYYGAYFRDPDGNKLCVVCHRPE